jgi:hypothetical protein
MAALDKRRGQPWRDVPSDPDASLPRLTAWSIFFVLLHAKDWRAGHAPAHEKRHSSTKENA